MQDDTVAIINTVPNGPSEKIGIKAGDRIIRVNDSLVAGVKMPSDDIVKMLKGKRGTKVKVTIIRRGVLILWTLKSHVIKFPLPALMFHILSQMISA